MCRYGWALQFDRISVGIIKVQGQPLPFGAEVCSRRSMWRYSMILQVKNYRFFVEWINPEAEMVDISTLLARSCAAQATELAIKGDKIDQ